MTKGETRMCFLFPFCFLYLFTFYWDERRSGGTQSRAVGSRLSNLHVTPFYFATHRNMFARQVPGVWGDRNRMHVYILVY